MLSQLLQLAKDLQENIFQNECGEDAHEALRLTFRMHLSIPSPSFLIIASS
jgi:hypothetical protein